MKSVIDLCNENTKYQSSRKLVLVTIASENAAITKDLPVSDLYTVIEHHTMHMQFPKEHEVY